MKQGRTGRYAINSNFTGRQHLGGELAGLNMSGVSGQKWRGVSTANRRSRAKAQGGTGTAHLMGQSTAPQAEALGLGIEQGRADLSAQCSEGKGELQEGFWIERMTWSTPFSMKINLAIVCRLEKNESRGRKSNHSCLVMKCWRPTPGMETIRGSLKSHFTKTQWHTRSEE